MPMRLLPCVAAICWAALLLTSTPSAATERAAYALIVANNIGLEADQAPLRFADDDGARYHEMLSSRVKEAVLLSVL
ncbi:MAG TPA: hypothetical protein VK420_19240, partial [Longimicrobium sp.]|nr:hypothetical protein [Longimicrobium sp.]